MKDLPQHRFQAGEFTETDHHFEDCAVGEDWENLLRRTGWHQIARVPDHQNRDSATLSCYLYRQENDTDSAFGSFFIEMLMCDYCILHIFCPTVMDFLQFLRDWLRPLVNMFDRDILTDAAIQTTDVLFDSRNGLACAVRKARQDRMDRYNREEANRKPATGYQTSKSSVMG